MSFTGSNWGRRVLLTGLTPSASLTGFVALVALDNIPVEAIDTGGNSALNGGGDLRFSTDDAGVNQLPLEVVSFVTNAVAGSRSCQLWIRFPDYASGTREVYMFYGKAGEVQPAVTASFGRNDVRTTTRAAWHMDSLNPVDVTGNNFDGVSTNCQLATGQVGQSLERLSSSNRVVMPYGNLLLSTETFTIDSWIMMNGRSGSVMFYQFDTDLASGFQCFEVQQDSYRTINFGSDGSLWARFGIDFTPVLGKYYHLVVTYNGNYSNDILNFAVYLDGIQQTVLSSGNYGGVPNENGFLARNNGDYSVDGGVDEQRVDSIELSADYILAEYNNQSSPSTFWITGTPENTGGTPPVETFKPFWVRNIINNQLLGA